MRLRLRPSPLARARCLAVRRAAEDGGAHARPLVRRSRPAAAKRSNTERESSRIARPAAVRALHQRMAQQHARLIKVDFAHNPARDRVDGGDEELELAGADVEGA